MISTTALTKRARRNAEAGLLGETDRVDAVVPKVHRGPRWQRRYARILVLNDFLMALVGATVVGFARWQDPKTEIAGVPAPLVGLALACAWLGVLQLRGAYDRGALGFGIDEFRRVLNSGVHLLAVLAILAYALDAALSRAFVFGSLILIVGLTMAGRYCLRLIVHRQRRSGRAMHRVLVVGTRDSVRNLAVHFARAPQAGYAVAGVCLPSAADDTYEVAGRKIPVLGEPSHVAQILERTALDVVAIADTTVLSSNELRDLAWSLTGRTTELVVAPAIADLAGPRISVNPVAGLPLLHVDEPQFNRATRTVKSVAESAVAAVAVVLLAPLLALIALLIKATSKGPALFKQERVGLDGRRFRMLKFRTMVADAEQQLPDLLDQNEFDGLLFKIQDDPRVTSVGKWLRRFSLDELPQLFHVVRGTMALVGPRPHPTREVEMYDDIVRRRLLVRPGLTGLWQVSGRSDLSWEESVRLDSYYIENWSLGLDAVILLKTLTAVVRASGAY